MLLVSPFFSSILCIHHIPDILLAIWKEGMRDTKTGINNEPLLLYAPSRLGRVMMAFGRKQWARVFRWWVFFGSGAALKKKIA